MTYVVVDTSVVLKLFLAYCEEGIDEAWTLLRQHRDGNLLLVAPAIGLLEIANILRYIGVDERTAIGLLEDYEGLGIELAPATPARVRAAVSCAFAHKISIYDAMFLALAQEYDCELATADRRAFRAIPADIASVRMI